MKNTIHVYNADFFDPALLNYIVAVSVHTIKILVSYQQTILVNYNRFSQNFVSNTLGVASYGCNRLQYVFFGGCTRLTRAFVKNDETDFVI